MTGLITDSYEERLKAQRIEPMLSAIYIVIFQALFTSSVKNFVRRAFFVLLLKVLSTYDERFSVSL